MRGRTWWALVATLLLALVLAAAGCGGDDEEGDGGGEAAATTEEGGAQEQGPIVIGAAIDQTNFMRFFDGPALVAAQIQADKINEAGGVGGRQIEFRVENHQLKPENVKAVATDLVEGDVDIGWVTCDVDWSTPAIQEFTGAGKLTIAPCIGTDQMGPKRFGDQGELAFSFGNVAQDEGAAIAHLAVEKGFKTAHVVTDKVIVYTQNVCQAFKERFTELGGKVVRDESFTQGDKTISNVVSRVNSAQADAIVICTITDKDIPTFVSGVRSLGNNTPILSPWSIDGSFWLPKNPNVSDNIWVVTFASVYGDDPNPEVQELIEEMQARDAAPATGGFIGGAAAIQTIAHAIEETGSTEGEELAKVIEGLSGFDTISGKISFSDEWHTVFGREFRVIHIEKGKPKFAQLIKTTGPADIAS
jgi:branched-chain amino acid transport system substrate-binding protein